MSAQRTVEVAIGLTLGICMLTAIPVLGAEPDKPATARAPDWREQYAYTLGVQAYLYGLPWAYMPQVRWERVVGAPGQKEKAPANTFYHFGELVNAKTSQGGGPNNDTLYSRAWIDVGPEPIILSVPEILDRYHTFEIAGFDSDNFAYVGTRTTGGRAGHFAIVGPNWNGTLPKGVEALPPSPTRWVFIVGRTLIRGEADVPAVRALQAQYKLTPLSQWGQASPAPKPSPEVWQPPSPKNDPLAKWKTMNRAMAENPPPARDADLLQLFARIGVGPGLDVDAQDTATKRGLARAAVDGGRIIAEAFTAGYGQKKSNGWVYPPPTFGRITPTRDWLMRAIQNQVGVVASDPEDGVYLNASLDGTGKPLTGKDRYTIRFAPGELPKVKAFWSVTIYDKTYNLVDNPINRYSISDRTPGIKTDADGGLTFYVQRDSPGPAMASNWLPTPAGDFILVLRTYLPDESIVKQTWQPPAVRKRP